MDLKINSVYFRTQNQRTGLYKGHTLCSLRGKYIPYEMQIRHGLYKS